MQQLWLQLVYLVLVRSAFILEQSPIILELITLIGAMTAFFAATVGLVQYDIKRRHRIFYL